MKLLFIAILIAHSSLAAEPSQCLSKEFQLGLFYRLDCARGSVDGCQVVEAEKKTNSFYWAALAVMTANAMLKATKGTDQIKEPFDMRKLAHHLVNTNILFKKASLAINGLQDAILNEDATAIKKYRAQLLNILDDASHYSGQKFLADERNQRLLNDEKMANLKKVGATSLGEILQRALVEGIKVMTMKSISMSRDPEAQAKLWDFLREVAVTDGQMPEVNSEKLNAKVRESNVASRARTANVMKAAGELGLAGAGAGLMILTPAVLSSRAIAKGLDISFKDAIDLQTYMKINDDKIHLEPKALADLFSHPDEAEKVINKHPAFCTALMQVNNSLKTDLAKLDAQDIDCHGGSTHITYRGSSANGTREFTLDIERTKLILRTDRKYALAASMDPNQSLVWTDFAAEDGFTQKFTVVPKELAATYVGNKEKCSSKDIADALQQRCDIGEDVHRNSLYIIQARNKCAEVQEASLSPAALESSKTAPGY